MINNVTFTGRETMLTKGIEKTVSKAHEYVSAGKIYPKAVVDSMEKEAAESKFFDRLVEDYFTPAADTYTSPFAVTTGAKAASTAQAQANNFSYAIAHGKPQSEATEAAKHINYLG